MKSITLHSPLDMHIHFRQGEMLSLVAPLSAGTFAGGVIMPNLVPPVDSVEYVLRYKEEIRSIVGDKFDPYMTLFFKQYTEAELAAAKPHIIGVKLYPAGITTNSDGGVSAIKEAYPTLRMMEEMGIPLLVHGETNGFVMDREKEFITIYDQLGREFPRLRITMEHITTAEAVRFLDKYENVFATVTLQHLLITLDDVAGGLLRPHLFCKPIAKRPEDRDALLEAALQAHPKLMFGSDSAPHPVHAKECCGCAAGVFTAPIAVQSLVQLFEQHHSLANLQDFISNNARRIYGVQPPEKLITVSKREFSVPERYGNVVPMFAGEQLAWSIVE